MQCVKCKGYELVPHELDDGLVAAQCQRCTGALLSLLNYRFWVQKKRDKDVPVMAESMDPVPVEDQTSAKQCPKCSRLMLKYRLSSNVNNRLDFCSSCDEVWLDKNEWQLFKQLKLAVDLPQLQTDSWQRHLRDEQRAASLKQSYSNLLGSTDYEKVATFKQWLDQHPHKNDIKHFLTMQY